MIRKIKLLLFFGMLVILNRQEGYAQVERQVTIDAGIEANEASLLLFNGLFGLAGGYIKSEYQDQFFPPPYHVFPAFSLMGEYGISKKSGVGLALTFQQVNVYPDYPVPYIYIPPNATEVLTRLCFGLRYLHYVNGKGNFYYGFRAGFSLWLDAVPAGMDPHFAILSSHPYISPYGAFQFLLGYRYYFMQHVAINAELALGSPYYANGGITCRIGKEEKPVTENLNHQ